jgi:hypothetical protein
LNHSGGSLRGKGLRLPGADDEMGSRRFCLEEKGPVIRQAISCDICGRDKQQTNHWFVAYEHGAELRIAGWSSQARLRTSAKHLCGQTCLHKLVEDYMARTLATRSALPIAERDEEMELPAATHVATDASLTSAIAHPPPARIAAPVQATCIDGYDSTTHVLKPNALTPNQDSEIPVPHPSFKSRIWRAEAWKREQEREMRGALDSSRSRRRSIV